MTRQYIGARYVPIFDGEYNSEKVYEPLTIVTYLNSSYTSKKTVPAGTLPTNGEFWALTGNYNAQLQEVNERSLANSQRIKELEYLSVFVTPQMYGALADGVHDDTAAINLALSHKNVFFPAGTYLVSCASNESSALNVASNSNIVLDENSNIVLADNAFTHYTIIDITNKSNVHISGGNVVGYRNEGDSGEFGYGVLVKNSNNVVIENLRVSKCRGDGLIVDKKSTNITFFNVESYSNKRQGLSVCSAKNLLIDHCYFHDTSGTAPQAGIDIEPYESDCLLENIVIRDTITRNNSGHGFMIFPVQCSYVDITLDNCFSESDGNNGLYIGNVASNTTTQKGSVHIDNIRVHSARRAGVVIENHYTNKCGITVNAPYIYSCNRANAGEVDGSAIVILGEGGKESTNNSPIGNIMISHLNIADSDIKCESPVYIYTSHTFKNITIDTPVCVDGCNSKCAYFAGITGNSNELRLIDSAHVFRFNIVANGHTYNNIASLFYASNNTISAATTFTLDSDLPTGLIFDIVNDSGYLLTLAKDSGILLPAKVAPSLNGTGTSAKIEKIIGGNFAVRSAVIAGIYN